MKFKEYFRALLIITQFIIFQCLFFYSLESNVNESSLNNMLDLCELQLTDKVCCGNKFDGKWVKPPLPASHIRVLIGVLDGLLPIQIFADVPGKPGMMA